MKGSRLYMIVLLAFLVFVFLFEYMAPHQFSWKATYNKHDKEPFGSYVFHDILSSSVDSFSVTDKTFYQIFQADSMATPRAFLLTDNHLNFNETDIDYLYKLLHLGNQVMICTENFPYLLEDTLCFETNYDAYHPAIHLYVKEKRQRDSIFFGTDTLCPEKIYEVYPQMHPISITTGTNKWVYLQTDNDTIPEIPRMQRMKDAPEERTGSPNQTENPDNTSEKEAESDEDVINNMLEYHPLHCDSFQILVWNKDNKPLVLRAFIGKGELFIVTTPLMFTNYNMLDGANASYAFRLLSYMKDKPLVRVEGYGNYSEQPRTPLRYVLSVPTLRWAIYSTLILVILFMIFTARRRQRVIPVVKSPPNRSFGFMQLISNLYYQRHDNGEILKMKYTYFASEVNKLTGIDLQERVPEESDYQRFAEKTGMEIDLLKTLLKNIQMAVYRSEIDDTRLKQYIDGMNDILRAMYT